MTLAEESVLLFSDAFKWVICRGILVFGGGVLAFGFFYFHD